MTRYYVLLMFLGVVFFFLLFNGTFPKRKKYMVKRRGSRYGGT